MNILLVVIVMPILFGAISFFIPVLLFGPSHGEGWVSYIKGAWGYGKAVWVLTLVLMIYVYYAR